MNTTLHQLITQTLHQLLPPHLTTQNNTPHIQITNNGNTMYINPNAIDPTTTQTLTTTIQQEINRINQSLTTYQNTNQ